MSESEYECSVKKRRGRDNIKELMKSTGLKGEEFVTTGGRLTEKRLLDPSLSVKRCVLVHLFLITEKILLMQGTMAVSYTHLDVYKRQLVQE